MEEITFLRKQVKILRQLETNNNNLIEEYKAIAAIQKKRALIYELHCLMLEGHISEEDCQRGCANVAAV